MVGYEGLRIGVLLVAIAFRATGSASFGINSITPVIPTAQVVGDMMLLLVAGKPYDGAVSVSGWTQLTEYTDGTVAAGVDVGSMQVTAWWKEATADPETNPTMAEGTPAWNVFGGLVMVFSKAAGESWATPVIVGGGDSTAGTAFSVTGEANPGVTTGDACVSFAGFPSDAATPLTTHIVATQAGVTFTNTHDPATDPETVSGGDMGMCVNRATVSGTGSAAPVIAGTLAAAHTGSAAFIRLRVQPANQTLAAGTPVVTITAPAIAVVAAVTLALGTPVVTMSAPAVTVLTGSPQTLILGTPVVTVTAPALTIVPAVSLGLGTPTVTVTAPAVTMSAPPPAGGNGTSWRRGMCRWLTP